LIVWWKILLNVWWKILLNIWWWRWIGIIISVVCVGRRFGRGWGRWFGGGGRGKRFGRGRGRRFGRCGRRITWWSIASVWISLVRSVMGRMRRVMRGGRGILLHGIIGILRRGRVIVLLHLIVWRRTVRRRKIGRRMRRAIRRRRDIRFLI
jgi:hypothetical protein